MQLCVFLRKEGESVPSSCFLSVQYVCVHRCAQLADYQGGRSLLDVAPGRLLVPDARNLHLDCRTPGSGRRAQFSHPTAVVCTAETVEAAAKPFRHHHPGCGLCAHPHCPETGPHSKVKIAQIFCMGNLILLINCCRFTNKIFH